MLHFGAMKLTDSKQITGQEPEKAKQEPWDIVRSPDSAKPDDQVVSPEFRHDDPRLKGSLEPYSLRNGTQVFPNLVYKNYNGPMPVLANVLETAGHHLSEFLLKEEAKILLSEDFEIQKLLRIYMANTPDAMTARMKSERLRAEAGEICCEKDISGDRKSRMRSARERKRNAQLAIRSRMQSNVWPIFTKMCFELSRCVAAYALNVREEVELRRKSIGLPIREIDTDEARSLAKLSEHIYRSAKGSVPMGTPTVETMFKTWLGFDIAKLKEVAK